MYADVVLLCLQYEFDSVDDDDGIALGVRYMERTLLRVHNLKIVD